MKMKEIAAPEVYGVAVGERRGYGFPVDWWSMGISIFELLKRRRPYSIHASMSLEETWVTLMTAPALESHLHNVSEGMRSVVAQLLELEPQKRLCSLSDLQQHSYMTDVNMETILAKRIAPPFIPSKEQLNCDPTYELEEMIIETKPLHKKKKRLAKQNSKHSPDVEKEDTELQNVTKMFRYYNRDQCRRNKNPLLNQPSAGSHSPSNTHSARTHDHNSARSLTRNSEDDLRPISPHDSVHIEAWKGSSDDSHFSTLVDKPISAPSTSWRQAGVGERQSTDQVERTQRRSGSRDSSQGRDREKAAASQSQPAPT